MSTVLADEPMTRTLFGYALMRDEHGEEMHKSKGNAIPFDEAAERIGTDVMRWMFMATNPATTSTSATDPATRWSVASSCPCGTPTRSS